MNDDSVVQLQQQSDQNEFDMEDVVLDIMTCCLLMYCILNDSSI